MSSTLRDLLKQRFLPIYFIWMGLFISIFLYVFVCYQRNAASSIYSLEAFSESFANSQTQAIVFMAGVMTLLHLWLPKKVFAAQVRRYAQAQDVLGTMKNQLTKGRRVWSDAEMQKAATLNAEELLCLFVFPRWAASQIVAWALAESVVVFGLTQAFAHWQFTVILPFAAVAAFLFVLRFPNVEKFHAQFQEVRARDI